VKKAVLLLISAVTCTAASHTTFDLDAAQTEIKFSVQSTLHTVHGTFKIKRGSIQLDSQTGKSSGEIVIDLASGESGNGPRDKRMHKEIIESQKYPDAVFTPDHFEGHIAPQGTSGIDVHGDFRIHGADHDLTMHFQVQANISRYIATTHFTIPYVQWGMKNPSNFLLKVADTIDVEVRAVALEKSQVGDLRHFLGLGGNAPIDRNLAFGQQLTFFQMSGFAGEVRSVRVVRDHHNGFAELLIES